MTPLVLVHGFMGSGDQWRHLQQFVGQHRSVLCVTLPGFGERCDEPAVTSVEGFAAAVLADPLVKDLDSFDLLGHSMGGMVVQEMTRQESSGRIKKLVLYGTGATGSLPGRFETIEQSKERARLEGLQNTARRIAATWFAAGETALAYPDCARIAEQTAPDAFEGGLDAMQAWSGEVGLRGISNETLVVWGDRDRTYPWQQTQVLWDRIDDARLCVLAGCAHAVHLEKPDLFNRVLVDFLET